MIATQYTVTKTGFEMADVCRAYGLAEVVGVLSRVEGRDDAAWEIPIDDIGWQWRIEGPDLTPDEATVRTAVDQLTAHLFTGAKPGEVDRTDPAWFLARGWNYLYVTNLAKDKTGAAERLRAILPEAIQELTSEGEVSAGVAGITTPQGLETAGGKGSRAGSRGQYGEGQSNMPERLWALAAIGAMNVGTFLWPRQGQGFAMVVPHPKSISYADHIEVRNVVRQGGMLCPTSTLTAIAHYCVKLALAVRGAAQRPGDWAQVYSHAVFESMAKTGQRPKPSHGGLFPMDFLNEIIDSGEGAGETLQTWDKLLTIGGFPGNEALAISLTDFLMHPHLRSFERHCRTHLRMFLQQNVSVLYPTPALERMMEHV